MIDVRFVLTAAMQSDLTVSFYYNLIQKLLQCFEVRIFEMDLSWTKSVQTTDVYHTIHIRGPDKHFS